MEHPERLDRKNVNNPSGALHLNKLQISGRTLRPEIRAQTQSHNRRMKIT